MTPNGNSLGLDAEDEARTRTDELPGYDSELDDEYDTEARTGTGTGTENRTGAVTEAERDGRVEGDEGDEGDENDSLATFGANEPLAAADTETNAYDDADTDRREVDGETPAAYSAPDSEPGLENEEQLHEESDLDSEREDEHNPQIVGAAATQYVGGDALDDNRLDNDRLGDDGLNDDGLNDDGLDEVEGRSEFDRAVSTEEVAGYDDSAAGYELAEQTNNGQVNAQAEPAAHPGETGSQPLLSDQTRDELLQRWTDIQVSFVDDPGASVSSADALIRDIGTAIEQAIHERTEQISGSWQGTADTEQLRLSLQEYRSFLGVVLPK